MCAGRLGENCVCTGQEGSVLGLGVMDGVVTSRVVIGRLRRIMIHFSNSSNSNVRLTNGVFSGISTAMKGSVYAFPSCPTSVHTPRKSLANMSNFRMRVKTDGVFAPNSHYGILITVGPTTLGARVGFYGPRKLVVASSSSFKTGSLRGTGFAASGPFRRLNIGRRMLRMPVSSVYGRDLGSSKLSGGTVLHYGGVFTLKLIY